MKPVLWTVFSFVFLFTATAHASVPPINTKSSKYAALVMDADTGEVFFARNADKRRYPASLTKMMTLYMLFEALKAGDMTLNTRLPVSERAAKQPQTNISLKAGQTIRVRDAIKALVVRSANDVSVVVAEALGKSEWNFALKMTAKARSLGMRRTQFRNAHGLPDVQQYTTARDMAKLSIALRRDFPQYYHFFTTQQFKWGGRTYKSHNKVLDQFEGVDGLKTGYIRMSGYNLASSVKRDGYHVVAIVMGGQTSRSRNNHMVSLLTKTFTQIAERGDQPRAFANAPVPSAKPTTQQASATRTTVKLPWMKREKPQAEIKVVSAEPIPMPKPKPAIEAKEQKPKTSFRFVSEPTKSQIIRQNTLNFQLASLSKEPSVQEKWGIQVGAFRDPESALKAASNAVKVAKDYLKDSKVNITDYNAKESSIHRARLANLTERQAKRACKTLSQNSTPCFVFKLDNRQKL